MTSHIPKIVYMIDNLAQKAEVSGDLTTASKLDAISQLIVTADSEITPSVTALAKDLQKYFPSLDTEKALHLSKELHLEFSTTEKGEEKESIFPISALPHKERKEGPRPQDVPIGTVEWWSDGSNS